jgi:hypothetical protein
LLSPLKKLLMVLRSSRGMSELIPQLLHVVRIENLIMD